MHKLATLLLFMGLSLYTYSQKLPSFGKIDKADLEYKECPYQKDAAAEYLIDLGEVSYLITPSEFINETKYRVRVKVLKEDGIKLANIRIPFYSAGNRQSINRIEGVTYNLDESGNIVKTNMEKKSIMEQKLDDGADMKVFTLPNVKVGSVFEYTYYHVKKNYLEIEDWIFQRSYPVRHSEYSATLHPLLRYTYQVRRTLPMQEKDEGINNSTKTFIMKEIPGLENEPYMSSANDYLQKVDFQLNAIDGKPILSSWKNLVTELMEDEDFGGQLKKNVFRNTTLPAEIKEKKTELEKMTLILSYVIKNVPWDGHETIWCKTGVKNAIEKHSGNSADVNLLLVNLLRDAGLIANPVLVSTRDHGKTNPFYPFLNQFNNVYVYVEADNKSYILDATNKNSAYNLVPWDVQFTDGYLVDKDNSRFITLADLTHKYKITTLLSGEIQGTGQIKGSATILAADYAKNKRLSTIRKGKEDYLNQYFKKANPSFNFDSIEITNDAVDSIPLESKVQFNGTLNSSGEYFFFSPNFLIEHEKNEFISDIRFTDIEFGFAQSYSINASIRFSSELELEELPKNMRIIMPDTSIVLQRLIQKDQNLLMFRITVDIKRPTYYQDEYQFFKEFYQRFFEILNEQIVFRKKAKPNS